MAALDDDDAPEEAATVAAADDDDDDDEEEEEEEEEAEAEAEEEEEEEEAKEDGKEADDEDEEETKAELLGKAGAEPSTPPGVGALPSLMAFAMSMAFHLAYFFFSKTSSSIGPSHCSKMSKNVPAA